MNIITIGHSDMILPVKQRRCLIYWVWARKFMQRSLPSAYRVQSNFHEPQFLLVANRALGLIGMGIVESNTIQVTDVLLLILLYPIYIFSE